MTVDLTTASAVPWVINTGFRSLGRRSSLSNARENNACRTYGGTLTLYCCIAAELSDATDKVDAADVVLTVMPEIIQDHERAI